MSASEPSAALAVGAESPFPCAPAQAASMRVTSLSIWLALRSSSLISCFAAVNDSVGAAAAKYGSSCVKPPCTGSVGVIGDAGATGGGG
eukprot:2115052-Pyramimonas_sp.AAC.1